MRPRRLPSPLAARRGVISAQGYRWSIPAPSDTLPQWHLLPLLSSPTPCCRPIKWRPSFTARHVRHCELRELAAGPTPLHRCVSGAHMPLLPPQPKVVRTSPLPPLLARAPYPPERGLEQPTLSVALELLQRNIRPHRCGWLASGERRSTTHVNNIYTRPQ